MTSPNPLLDVPRPTKTYHTKAYPRISPDQPALSLKGKTMLIIGGGTGIGRVTCDAFAEAGLSRIIIVGISPGPQVEAKSELELKHKDLQVLTYESDVTDSARMAKVVSEVGKIDILIINASYVHNADPVAHLSAEQLAESFRVNVVTPFTFIDAIMGAPSEKRSEDLKIIHISTALAHTHIPILSGYGASKAAFNHLICHMAAQWGDQGVSAFNLHPGLFYTSITKMSRREDEIP